MIRKFVFSLFLLVLVVITSACNPTQRFTIYFESNGGTAVAPIATDGKSIVVLPDEPEMEGYFFDGWFLDNDTFAIPFSSRTLSRNPIEDDITVFAKWVEDAPPSHHLVSFDTMGGSTIVAVAILHDGLIVQPFSPVRSEYVFEDWYADTDYERLWDFSVDRVTSSFTLYAKWRDLTYYQVTFNSNSDISVSTQTVPEANKLITPSVLREGYRIEGWYTSNDNGITLDRKWRFTIDNVEGDMTLYANWVVDQFTIIFRIDSGVSYYSTQLDYQETIDAIEEPTKGGYEFDGWYLDQEFSQPFTLTQMPGYNVNVYAKWRLQEDIEPNVHDVIRLVTYSYFNQGVQIQYDQGTGRRLVSVSPESATADHYLYVDCSSFVNAVYNEAFGIFVTPNTTTTNANTNNYMEFARINRTTSSEVIYYIENATVTNPVDQTALLASVWEDLEVGDLVVYRRNNDTAGHVIIYVGDDMFLHSTGSGYDYTNATERMETNGTVLKLQARDLFTNTGTSRYLFSSNVNKIAVLRPLNRPNITYTASSLTRFKLPGIDVEKSSTTPNFSSVALGEEITYYITLKNFGIAPLYNFTVTDSLSPLVSLVGIGDYGEWESDSIVYYISQLGPNQSLQLEYTVAVTDDVAHIGEMIENNNTFLENIPTNHLYATIIGYDSEDIDYLLTAIDERVNSTSYTSSISLMKDIYDQFANDMGTTNPLSSFTSLTAIYNSDMVVPMLHGGRTYNQSSAYNRELRVRLLFLSHLSPGDMLFLYNGSTFKPYIYSGTYFISLDIPSGIVVQYANPITMNQILVTAISYTSYKVIRPLTAISP